MFGNLSWRSNCVEVGLSSIQRLWAFCLGSEFGRGLERIDHRCRLRDRSSASCFESLLIVADAK
eukprot:2279576-Rhodomonas_salina.1